MLERINNLLIQGKVFAFETTLATKSYRNFILKAKENKYNTTLIFFWLLSPDLAVKRVQIRVKEGGHNITEDVIRRRYENGLKNFFGIFESIVDEWIFIDNSEVPYYIIASKKNGITYVNDQEKWTKLINKYKP
jgi:predicted ABC-type ATPase